MANLFENKDRRVIPNWRSFKETVQLGELDSTENKSIQVAKELPSIASYIEDWKENKTIVHAGDLLSAAIVNSCLSDPNVIEAAEFISNHSNKATGPQIGLANVILKKQIEVSNNSLLFDDLDAFIDLTRVHAMINLCKKKLREFPYNAMLYVELSRLYSILGQIRGPIRNGKEEDGPALRAMKIALHLAPNNRYVLRSGARLYTHLDQIEHAHELIRRSPVTNHDPWLASAEISLATVREKSSRFMKRGIEMVDSKSLSPHSITELASAIGTVELISGSQKKSRRFFNTSLLSPNDNSLAQAEWANNSVTLFDNLNPRAYQVRHNHEALALNAFYSSNWQNALVSIKDWFLDMPYSKRPLMLGHHIAGTLLNNHEKAVKFCEIGLISNPKDPQIINNIAYSLAILGRTSEALKYLQQIEHVHHVQKTSEICLMATKGLILFRTNNPEHGRDLYLRAIEEASKLDGPYLNWVAILNYVREEILIKYEKVEELMGYVAKIPDDVRYKDVKKMKEDVIKLYEKNIKNNQQKTP
ncbi:MAG: hypothetical protein ACLQQ4_14575 [Bacteroidia bacterium]